MGQIHLQQGYQQEPAIKAVEHKHKDVEIKEEKTKVLPHERTRWA